MDETGLDCLNCEDGELYKYDQYNGFYLKCDGCEERPASTLKVKIVNWLNSRLGELY